MTAISRTPSNPNFLSKAGFKFIVARAPDLNFFIQKINLPSIAIQPTQHPNPLVKIPYSGEHMDYDPLTVTFKVDENMNNWIAMYAWMKGLGFPNNFQEYNALIQNGKKSGQGVESDLKLFILTSHLNPQIEVTFRDAFPISLTGLEFDSTAADVDYLESSVSFGYTSYAINLGPL